MVELGSVQPAPKSDAEFENLFALQIAELHSLDERMQRDRSEIERIKLDTAQLRREGHELEVETRAILARIRALV